MNKPRNVCESVVSADLCIGCGLCAGVCPSQVLEMRFNQYGEYIPVEYRQGCLPKCDLCLRTCPFWDQQDDNEDTLASQAFNALPHIQKTSETGYYLAAFAGYSLREEQRLSAASGGLATWFLKSLLETGIVDRVACVMPNADPEKLFKFSVLSDPNAVLQSGKSCYYPVELSNVIREIIHTEARYAVIALPCYLKGIRLAMRKNRQLRRRIKVLAGLVCGQTKSKFFAEYLCALGGGTPALMTRATFRVKDLNRPANDFGFRFECRGGAVDHGTVFWLEGMDKAWMRGYFKPNACNYCDDIFAEVADVVFMDAWLERYIREPQGTNLVLIRNPEILHIFEQGQRHGSIHLECVSIEDVITSQQGVISVKRSGLAERLRMAEFLRFHSIPRKRVDPIHVSYYHLCQLWLQRQLILQSKRAFSRQRERNGLARFERRMFPILFALKVLSYVQGRVTRILKKEKLGFQNVSSIK